ncbi:AAA family ATPase [Anaerosphaera multitolerans]|uniref:Nuclease SbcCD subunit C n=1 Tax=Anaerosphaera multitolerans TaxID=2487351 RepID=A0A437S569_9FIRM|nr:AAA family ATPase [Anaerosphaera multitolerans]RVU54161.1 chromosome segregation protein SMC [Anaerosphaera multitolerans]
MIFITKLELINFQSHENSIFEFDRGLNVILGKSDSGKTAVLRAIKWALYNEPLGDYFIREGEKEVSVTIYFNTGAIVRRYRSSSKNSYYLKKHNGEEYNFEGFGVDVPKEIKDEIGMRKINLDNKETNIINIAEQLEGPFLLNEKSSIRASAIGRLVGVNYVDDALRETVRDNKAILSNIKSLNIQKEELINKIKEFDYIDGYEEKLDNLIDIKENIQNRQNKLSKLNSIKSKFSHNSSEIKNTNSELDKYIYIDKFEDIYTKIENKLTKYLRYKTIYNKLLNNKEYIQSNKRTLEKLAFTSDMDIINLKLNENIKSYKFYFNLNENFKKINYDIELNLEIKEKYKSTQRLDDIKNCLDVDLENYNKLTNLQNKIFENNKSLNKGEIYINRFKDLDKLNTLYKDISNKNTLLKKYLNLYINYKNVMKKIDEFEITIRENEESLTNMINKYNDILLNVGYCPLCHSKISESTIDHIKEHYGE